MGLFTKKQQEPAPLPETSYDDVVDYLRGMTQQDYNKITKVVNIYRNADKDVKKVLGIKENSVTDPATADDLADDLLLDDDTELGNFLEDEPKPKAKKITVKQ